MPTTIILGENSETKKPTAVKIDNDVGGVIITDHVHHEVHEGEMFSASYVVPHGSEISNDASQDFLFVTAATHEPHVFIGVAVGGDCEILLYEGATASNNGTGLAEMNMKRTSTNTPTVTTFHTPTIDPVGTLINHIFAPGGSGPQAGGVAMRSNVEWIFKVSTKYLLRVTNRSGSTIQLSALFQWYEEAV